MAAAPVGGGDGKGSPGDGGHGPRFLVRIEAGDSGEIVLGENGQPTDIERRAQDAGTKKAYQLIEELMIFANEAVARWLLEHELPGVYRVHLPPDPKKLDKLSAMCEMLGVEFDADNTHHYLNHIPFADHGALLDPPTADVTARCVSFLAQTGMEATEPAMARAIEYLRRDQQPDGSWFGRWGTNYIYGTWSVLCALNAAGLPHDDPAIQRAVVWLLAHQREDGGWGEDEDSYDTAAPGAYHTSTPSQTSWALLGLMAAGETGPAVARGAAYLARAQRDDGEWDEAPYTAVGFPKVFYLRYHGYRLFFPLLALARFRNLQRGNTRRVGFGF